MSDTAPEEKKTAPDGIARSLEEKERKNSGERPETKGDEPADNTRQRALSQCIEYLEDGESEYSHPADMAEHLENLVEETDHHLDRPRERQGGDDRGDGGQGPAATRHRRGAARTTHRRA